MTGNNSIELESVGSTQTYLKELLVAQQLPEGTLVFAQEQTEGRGTDGTQWESSKGLNLTFSFVWFPIFLKAEDQFQMNKAIALAIFDFVSSKIKSEEVKIKWPNDIYIGDKKVAGILIENAIMNNLFRNSIIGIGMNINQDQFYSTAPNPVSLKTASGKTYDIYSCLDEMCKLIDFRYNQLKNYEIVIDKEYKNNLYRLDTPASFNYKGSVIKARIKDVTNFGQLVLETEKGEIISCNHKEVQFLHD